MADIIKLNYEITNAEASVDTDNSKYLIVIDDESEVGEFTIPKELAGTYIRVQLGDPIDRGDENGWYCNFS